MRSSHPAVFVSICQQQGFSDTHTLALLLIVKKIIAAYGLHATQKEFIEEIFKTDKDTAIMLTIIQGFEYKTVEEIDMLINRVQRYCHETHCRVEVSFTDKQAESALEVINNTFTTHGLHPEVVAQQKLGTPGLHVSTNTHRYHRDIDSDLDTILS